MNRPFVVTLASEKGGVGKTTIATNLAVYLKALCEDLPVTIASFDNHFSVDQMFALGPRPENSIADLLAGHSAGELVVLGQYGVQYIASSREMQRPPHIPIWLSQQLQSAALHGILILDTRPILDWFTEAALLAADLVLVPVKDRASLVNAGALRQVLATAESVGRLWLLPSLVDTRSRLNAEVRVHEFLAYAARERDYQVLDICISKSPKVESLASGFSSCIRPVLTHARNTAVHGQLKQLAEFVLSRFDVASNPGKNSQARVVPSALNGMPVGHRRRLAPECPLCYRQALSDAGHFYFDLRSRRRGFIHPACFEQVSGDLNLDDSDDMETLVALTIDGPGLVAPECRLTAHQFDGGGSLVGSEEIELCDRKPLVEVLSMITGQSLDAAYRELILLNRVTQTANAQLANSAYRSFALRRGQVTRELRSAGLF